jgi:hypothetical protein
MLTPRKPTKQEIKQLEADLAYGLRHENRLIGKFERETAQMMVSSAGIAVFDDYDAGEYYKGKVMICVWEMDPGITTFTCGVRENLKIFPGAAMTIQTLIPKSSFIRGWSLWVSDPLFCSL